LEFKDDKEFPANFGSIAGNSSSKFRLFYKKETGTWTTGSSQNQTALSLQQAIAKAKQHHDQLLAGCKVLKRLPSNGSDEDYQEVQQEMYRVAPIIGNTAWAHKYFSLIYPDKLDNYHFAEHQRFHLIKLLQVPPYVKGQRYLASGRFIAIANSLQIEVNALTQLLNERHGEPHHYWVISLPNNDSNKSWETMRRGGYCAIGSIRTIDASTSTDDSESGESPRPLVQDVDDNKPTVVAKGIDELSSFKSTIKPRDLLLASNGGATILAMGRVTGAYFYAAGEYLPHRLPVQWLSSQSWQLPDQTYESEGKFSTVGEMNAVHNLITAEKRILEATYESSSQEPTAQTWRDYITRVLSEAEQPLGDKEIAARARALGMRTQGKTPDRTVNQILNANAHTFERVAPGLYRLKSSTNDQEQAEEIVREQLAEQEDILLDLLIDEDLPEDDISEPSPEENIDFSDETFGDTKLAPVPELQLQGRIAELRKHIMVEERLVQRIYHALLNGHVILTGPPGTGKTELAQLIPEILWQSEDEAALPGDETQLYTNTAYTTTLVTATSEWSTRTLISNITPVIEGNRIAYRTQHGHLTAAILRN
jgi:hypothetical protein